MNTVHNIRFYSKLPVLLRESLFLVASLDFGPLKELIVTLFERPFSEFNAI